jgi:ATP-binding cassette subfamily C protein
MRLLLVFLRTYPKRTALTLLCLVLGGLAEGIGVSSLLPVMRVAANGAPGLAGATALERGLDAALTSVGLTPSTHTLFALVLVGVVLKAGLTLLANRQVGYAVAQMTTSLRLDLISALLATRWSYYVHQPIGVIANSVALEATSAADAYLRGTTILALFVQAVVFATVASLVSWRATIVALAAGLLIAAVLNRLVRMARRAGKRQVARTRALLARLTDTLQAVKPLKAMAREPLIAPVLEGETQRLNRALEHEVMSRAALEALQDPLVMLFLAGSLYTGLTYFAMPLADLIILVLLCARIVGSFGKMQKEAQRMVVRESAFFAVRDLIQEAHAAVEVASGGRPPSLVREIRLAGVSFTHEVQPVLRDADMVVPAGSLTVLTGPSGAGKTTVVDLITGLLQPSAGAVLVDGVPLGEIAIREWRTKIGYVPQETLMLHQSVAHNVTLGDPTVSPADVAAALKAAGAEEFVAALPALSDTLVGERGLRLSGGQRQRLALARALVRKPTLLVLDEATTALDPATERAICETLRALRGSMTLIAICHHGRLVELADLVYRVEGTRIELVRAGAVDPARDVARG